jgi:hypothetical protein
MQARKVLVILCLLAVAIVVVSAQELDWFVYVPSVHRNPVCTPARPTPTVLPTVRPTVTSPWVGGNE